MSRFIWNLPDRQNGKVIVMIIRHLAQVILYLRYHPGFFAGIQSLFAAKQTAKAVTTRPSRSGMIHQDLFEQKIKAPTIGRPGKQLNVLRRSEKLNTAPDLFVSAQKFPVMPFDHFR